MSQWEKEQLGVLFQTITGNTPSKREKAYYGGKIPFIKPPELIDDVISASSDSLSNEGAKFARVLPKDSILVSCIGNLGKSGINSIPVAFNQQINAIIPNERSNPRFMFYQVQSFTFRKQLYNLKSGTTVDIVNKSKFNTIRVVLPSLPEQKRIVTILDQAFQEIDQTIANTEKNHTNAKEIFESYLNDVFTRKAEGWEEKKLGDVCDVIPGQSPESKFYNKTGNGLPFYQGKKEFREKFIGSPKTWTTHTTKKAQNNDILMSVRAPVGPINFCTQEICIGRGLAAIRAVNSVDKEFLFYFLLSIQDKLIGNAGAVFTSLNKDQIKDIRLVLPSPPEQKRIVKKLDELTKETQQLETLYQKKISALTELKQSLLQKAFSGELTKDKAA